jgi:hypothetical protein
MNRERRLPAFGVLVNCPAIAQAPLALQVWAVLDSRFETEYTETRGGEIGPTVSRSL